MGLFGKKDLCSICGTEEGIKKLSDGVICKSCQVKSGLTPLSWKNVSQDNVKVAIEAMALNQERISVFNTSKKIENYLFIDEERNWIQIPIHRNMIFSSNEIVSYEVLEDGESITKGGLGSAVVGGALFGGIGAIVGGTTGGKKTKKVIHELRIKLVTRNPIYPEVYINLLPTGKVKSGGLLYNAYYRNLQSILTALSLMKDKEEKDNISNTNPVSSADEIIKYKGLLDQGIINEDEFEAKKKQLLGL